MIHTGLISRPVAALVLAAILAYAGVAFYQALPRATMPNVELPIFVVSTEVGGAPAEDVMRSVTNPLIDEMSRISSIDTIEATNERGRSTIRIAIEAGEDAADVADDLRLAVSSATARLPPGLARPPTIRRLNPMSVPVLQVALSGTNRSIVELESFAANILLPRLNLIEGVNEIAGLERYRPTVRISLNPVALSARQITVAEVEAGIRAAAGGGSIGTIETSAIETPIGMVTSPASVGDFSRLPIISRDGNSVPLGDLGRIDASIKDSRHIALNNGRRSVLLAIYARDDADLTGVARSTKAALEDMAGRLPEGMLLEVVRDRSAIVEDAISEVEWTFAATVGLMMILLFAVTGNLGAAIVPSVILPLSLSLTVVGLWAFGLTINNITLIALTLSVGLVVDDAIVVHENIVRHFERGLSPAAAAIRGVSEVGFTVIAMTVSLVVVFVPMLLLDGVLGQIMQSFAVTLILALCASAVTSLLFSPVAAAHWLGRYGSRPGRTTGTWFLSLTTLYEKTLANSLRRPSLMLACTAATVGAGAWLLADLPRSFLPQTDSGRVIVTVEARPDVSTSGMLQEQEKVARVIGGFSYVRNVLFERGMDGTPDNVGILDIELKSRPERPDIQTVIAQLQQALARMPSVKSTVVSDQAARHGREQRGRYSVSVTTVSSEQLHHWTPKLYSAMEKAGAFRQVSSTLASSVAGHDFQISLLKAQHMGIDPSAARRSMAAAFSGSEVAMASIGGRAHGVQISLEADEDFVRWLDLLHERNSSGQPVPYSAFIDVETMESRLRIEQTGLRPAAEIFFEPADDVPLEKAMGRLDVLIASLDLPPEVTVDAGGEAKDLRRLQSTQAFLIVASIAAMFLVLAILYESFTYPVIILAGLPSALLGGTLALAIWQMPLSLMALIGLLVVLGIVKKNAIMMIDFALTEKRAGVASQEAIQQAAVQRFRPIMLTTVAALAGALPIAIGWGSGSDLRQPLGVVIAGGLILSQFVTLYITPSLFVVASRLSR